MVEKPTDNELDTALNHLRENAGDRALTPQAFEGASGLLRASLEQQELGGRARGGR